MFGSEWNGIGGLLGLLGIGGKVVDDFKGSLSDSVDRNDAKSYGRTTYIDRRGFERSVKTNNKVWHTTDSQGYRVTIDSKTKEILDSNKNEIERQNKEAKERAYRAGDYGYPVILPCRGINKTCYRRTSDDKPLYSEHGAFFYTPVYRLRCGKYDTTEENRRIVYDYCRKWYVDHNMKTKHPDGILEEAKEYGLVVYEDDIEYCLNKIDKAIETGCGYEYYDLDYKLTEH